MEPERYRVIFFHPVVTRRANTSAIHLYWKNAQMVLVGEILPPIS
jgi:hypothetical protein